MALQAIYDAFVALCITDRAANQPKPQFKLTNFGLQPYGSSSLLS